MTSTAVKLLYGPYECNGIIRHRSQKIYGLKQYFDGQGTECICEPSPHLNRLMVEVCKRVIYTCDIRFLKFNMPLKDDICAQRVVTVVIAHQKLFATPGDMQRYPHVSEGMRNFRTLEGHEICSISDDLDASDQYTLEPSEVRREHDEEESFGMDGLGDYYKEVYQRVYGTFLSPSSSENLTTSSSASSSGEPQTTDEILPDQSSSCACLSLEPPSLYSVCYGPPSPTAEPSLKVSSEAIILEDIMFGEEMEDRWTEILSSLSQTADIAAESDGQGAYFAYDGVAVPPPIEEPTTDVLQVDDLHVHEEAPEVDIDDHYIAYLEAQLKDHDDTLNDLFDDLDLFDDDLYDGEYHGPSDIRMKFRDIKRAGARHAAGSATPKNSTTSVVLSGLEPIAEEPEKKPIPQGYLRSNVRMKVCKKFLGEKTCCAKQEQ